MYFINLNLLRVPNFYVFVFLLQKKFVKTADLHLFVSRQQQHNSWIGVWRPKSGIVLFRDSCILQKRNKIHR